MKKLPIAAKFIITKTTVARFLKKQTPSDLGDIFSSSIVMPTGSV